MRAGAMPDGFGAVLGYVMTSNNRTSSWEQGCKTQIRAQILQLWLTYESRLPDCCLERMTRR